MLPSNRRPAARPGESRENAIFPSEETSTGSTVRALPNAKKKEREPTLIGLGVADRLGYGQQLENERNKAQSPGVSPSSVSAPQQAAAHASGENKTRDSMDEATTRFERDLADTCEVSLVEMEVLPKRDENLADAFGTYPQLSTIAKASQAKPRWWEGERGFTVALVASSLCAMLALVLVTTSRKSEVPAEPASAPASPATSAEGTKPVESPAVSTPVTDTNTAETSALSPAGATDSEAKLVAPAEKKRVKKRRKARREEVRGTVGVSSKLR